MSAEMLPLPKGIKPLSHQVAGHFYGKGSSKLGFLECEDGTILKPVQSPPRGERELKFYQRVHEPACTDSVLLELREFMPTYLGTWQTEAHPGVMYFRLNDVTKSFKNPCILDVKMGPITYDPLAGAEKIAKERAKYPPVEKIGFQLIGARIYRPASKIYEKLEKEYLRSLDEEEICSGGFAEFLNMKHGCYRPIVQAFLLKLRIIRQWFEAQRQFNFYASSILLVYDAADLDDSPAASVVTSETRTLSQDLCNGVNQLSNGMSDVGKSPTDARVSVNMIDFAHVFPSTDRDANYLKGLDGLIFYLEKFL